MTLLLIVLILYSCKTSVASCVKGGFLHSRCCWPRCCWENCRGSRWYWAVVGVVPWQSHCLLSLCTWDADADLWL